MLYENVLKHYGVKGMKWGVIRDKIALARKRATRNQSEDYKTKKALKRKKLSEMSNSEIKKLNERLQLEQNLKRLKAQDVSAGRKRAEAIVGQIGNKLLSAALDEATKRAMDRVLGK